MYIADSPSATTHTLMGSKKTAKTEDMPTARIERAILACHNIQVLRVTTAPSGLGLYFRRSSG
jgi:hypothetical protein